MSELKKSKSEIVFMCCMSVFLSFFFVLDKSGTQVPIGVFAERFLVMLTISLLWNAFVLSFIIYVKKIS